MTAGDLAQALTVVLLWGLNFSAVKTVMAQVPPLALCAFRFALVAVLLAPFFRPRLAQLPGILAIAVVLGVGHFGLLFMGLAGMDAASTAIVTQLGVPFSVLMSWAVFGDRLGWARTGGLILAFAGVALLAGEPHMPGLFPLFLGVVSMAAWAVSNVQIKKLGGIAPLALNGWVALFAAPLVGLVSWWAEDGQMAALAAIASQPHMWGNLAYTVIASSLIAYSLWYRLLARHPMSRIVPLTLAGPVIGVAGGVLLLGEPLTWQKLAGGAVTIGGVALIQALAQREGRA